MNPRTLFGHGAERGRPRVLGQFTAKNEDFTCLHCGREVRRRLSSYRNHCPFCLYSLHVDVFPGDRANSCRGLMRPIGYHLDGKKGLTIEFRCLKCHEVRPNIAAVSDPNQPDDYDYLLQTLTQQALEP
jgi:hypothetical protein